MRAALLIVPLALVGCGGAVEPPVESGPSDEACEHAQEGPAVASTASVTPFDGADITEPHARHDVALVDVVGGKGGFAQYDSAGGAHTFFLTKDIPVSFRDPGGNELAIDETKDETTCAEVVVAHHITLDVGKVFLGFGPTDEDTVSLVIEGENVAEEEE
jgi:hypothetical protein